MNLMLKAEPGQVLLSGAAARALERRQPATMLSMSGGVVHLTSRLVFCFASAPLVLVKLLRDEEVAQTDDCAYTWPTAGFRRRER